MRQRDIPFVSWRATQAGVGSASSAGPDITRDLPRPRGRAEGRLRPPVGGGPHDKRRTDMQNNLTRRNFLAGSAAAAVLAGLAGCSTGGTAASTDSTEKKGSGYTETATDDGYTIVDNGDGKQLSYSPDSGGHWRAGPLRGLATLCGGARRGPRRPPLHRADRRPHVLLGTPA